MDFTSDAVKVKELIDKAGEILIVTHEHPTFDSMGSTLALYLGLAGLGKKVTVACPDAMTVELANFVGANKVVSDLGKKNFVISLDYVDGSIEKVSYNIEGNKFNLVIEPRPGFEMFSQDKVTYSYAGSAAGLIFTVDTIHLGGLKKLFDDDKELYATKPIVNIDRHPNNAQYGHTNMVDPQASSTAEIVGQLLTGLGVAITPDIATNLFNAVIGATNGFQNTNIGPGAFELAAMVTKAGGKRFTKPAAQEERPVGGESVNVEPARRETPAPAPQPQPPVQTSVPTPVAAPHGVAPAAASQGTTSAQTPHGAAPTTTPQGAPGQAKQQKAPPDWLKPKIFKSSNLS